MWMSLGPWIAVYGGDLRAITLFCILTIVGVFSTLISRRGFINVASCPRPVVVRYSLWLIVVTGGCGLFSWYFKGNLLLEGTVPFVLVYVAAMLLSRVAATREA